MLPTIPYVTEDAYQADAYAEYTSSTAPQRKADTQDIQ